MCVSNHFPAISNDLSATAAAATRFPAARLGPFVSRRMDQSPVHRPQKSCFAVEVVAVAAEAAAADAAVERNSAVGYSVCCYRYAIDSG